jgi:23S rRNA pseudouridine1911/1915/1917 synthase
MLTQQQSPLEIIYHNGPCIVINKPAGVLTQAVPGIDSMEVRVKDYVRRQENKTGNVYVAVTHRLDRPVTGALIFARHVRAARRICEQFAGRIVQKTYWALVEGQVTESAGTWTDHIRKIPDVARAELVPEDHPDSRSAILRFKRVAMNNKFTLLEIQLETGRTHQIRVQAAARGHQVLGDEHYGSTAAFGPPVTDPRQRAIGLHAQHLRFRHPMTREPVEVTAPPPSIWKDFLPAGLWESSVASR